MKMNQRTSVFVLFGSLACGLAVLAVTLHAATQTAGGTLALTEGVRIMRLVGSAEVSLAAGRDSPARYRALTEVLASPDAASFKGDVTVIDVRPREEYEAGHIPGALSVPVEELKRGRSAPPKSREVVAYCRGRYCVYAVEAVTLLRKRGYRARRLVDGLPDWRDEGRKVAVGS